VTFNTVNFDSRYSTLILQVLKDGIPFVMTSSVPDPGAVPGSTSNSVLTIARPVAALDLQLP
jgi:hypothetical protein